MYNAEKTSKRQLDALYMRQVWLGTRPLIDGRESAASSSAGAELDTLNFLKGAWEPTGKPFVGGVPADQPIGDFYPAGEAVVRNGGPGSIPLPISCTTRSGSCE